MATKDSPLERYISILEAIAPFADGLTAVELEAALDLPKTSINRSLHVLLDSGLISASNVRNRTFRLGDRLLKLLQTSPDNGWLATLAQRPLQALADATGQSAFISKFDGFGVSSVTCAAPDTPVRTYVVPGTPMPINATASAKAILAFQPAEIVARLLGDDLRRYTENTITETAALLEELAKVREKGFALDLAEHVAGLGSIAFPIQTSSIDINYAVGLTGPYGQIIDRDFNRHCQELSITAGKLSRLLRMRA